MIAVSPLAVYEASLRRAATGRPASITAVDDAGRVHHIDPQPWCADRLDGDGGLLDRCTGPTLDVGCGPGRLAAALVTDGRPALGIDVSATAVGLACARGALVLRRDVFGPLPGEGRWHRVLLADGNIGIGGDPDRLLRRCRQLVHPTGQILAELHPPRMPSWSGRLRLATRGGRLSAPFPWAYVCTTDLTALAHAAALTVLTRWTEAGRCFASLSPA